MLYEELITYMQLLFVFVLQDINSKFRPVAMFLVSAARPFTVRAMAILISLSVAQRKHCQVVG
jgi:hypothetical protein